jgi:hypothetical protein
MTRSRPKWKRSKKKDQGPNIGGGWQMADGGLKKGRELPAIRNPKSEIRNQPEESPLRIGPLVMRLGTEYDPSLRDLTDQEAVEEAVALMALSLNLLRESASIELKTKDEVRIERQVSQWLAEFDRLGQRWREERKQRGGQS